MRRNLHFILVLSSLSPLSAYADHPNEGATTLSQLTDEALKNSLELKRIDEAVRSAEFERKTSTGGFYPHIFIEGGPQTSRIGTSKDSGTSLYGRAEWNLYRGGADSSAINLANLKRDTELKRREATEARIRRDVARVYYEMQFVLESIAQKDEALKINSDQKKMAVLKNNAGFTSKTDVLEFELREATLLSDLVFLRQQLERHAKEMQAILSRSEPAPIAVKGHLTRVLDGFERSDLIKSIEQKNYDLVELALEKRSLEVEKAVIRSGFQPRLDLEGRYGKLGNAEKVNPDNDDYMMMLKFSVPVFSGLETVNASRGIQSSITSKSLDLEQRRIALVAELDDALSNINALGRRLDLEERNMAKSREYYENTVSEYKRGIKNSPDMVGAAERLLDARLRNLEYRRDLALERLKVFGLIGANPR